MAEAQPAGVAPAQVDRPAGRIGGIDVARGLAVLGMVLFHLDWDLAYWGWRDTAPTGSPAWMALAHTVAGTFLFLSGMCLVLARPRGLGAALRRIAGLAGAAAIVTGATLWLFPDAFIFFGILHCIAAANLIGLAVVDAPVWIPILMGGLAAAAPTFAASPVFDAPAWGWLGLSVVSPRTLDYRPLLPWVAPVLFGIAAARLAGRSLHRGRMPRWSEGLAWAGRHSLLVYVLHQPVLFGLFFLVSALHPPGAADQAAAFSRRCVAQCLDAGAGKAGCEAACGCVLRRVRAGLDPSAKVAAPTEADLLAASELCVRDGASGP